MISRLHCTSDERKRFEKECESIESRIHLLKLESRKVDKVLKRARTPKNNNQQEESIERKRQYQNRTRLRLQDQREKNFFSKEMSRITKFKNVENIAHKRLENAKLLKSQRFERQAQVQENQRRKIEEANGKMKAIQVQKQQAKLKILAFEERRIAQVRQDLEFRLKKEEAEKTKTRKKLKSLEELERQCVLELQGKKEAQQAVLHSLLHPQNK